MRKPIDGMLEDEYLFRNRSDDRLIARLWLEPEINYMSRFQDYHLGSFDSNDDWAFTKLCDWNEVENSQEWIDDAVNVCWLVRGEITKIIAKGEIKKSNGEQIAEFAPFPLNVANWSQDNKSFLTFFGWPINNRLETISWFHLPIKSRWPEFDQWMKHRFGQWICPGQQTVPLLSFFHMYEIWSDLGWGVKIDSHEIQLEKDEGLGGSNFVMFRDGYLESHRRQRRERSSESKKNRQEVYSSGDRGISWRAVAELDNWICHICGEYVERIGGTPLARRGATMDHVIPIAEGGPHSWNNVRCAHWECNMRKSDRI